jgi:hydroxymethylpyrimidine pyrophosphatase-like HAD family hydrolase
MGELPAIIFTDFDGTIKPPAGPVAEADIAALAGMGRAGVVRVVATGRSLFAFRRDWDPRLELDYLIFSSGLGVCAWSPAGPGDLIASRRLPDDRTALALAASLELGRGFFAFEPPPGCHRYVFHDPDRFPPTEGYLRRIELYREFGVRYRGDPLGPRGQFLITAPSAEMPPVRSEFERLCPGLSLLYSTSPLGDKSLWLEIFPPGVSKGAAASDLAGRLGLGPADAAAMGNDFNDLDLLAWASIAFLTADASKPVRHLHPHAPPSAAAPLAWLWARLLGADPPGPDPLKSP